MNLCFDDEGEPVCVGNEGRLSAGFSAPGPVAAELFVCEERPQNVACAVDERVKYTDLKLTSVENLQFKFRSHTGAGVGHAFINTEDRDKEGRELLAGAITRHEPNVVADGNVDLDLDATFSTEFWADNRFVRFNRIDAFPVRPKFGDVDCGPPGETELKVTVSPFPQFDLGDRICKD